MRNQVGKIMLGATLGVALSCGNDAPSPEPKGPSEVERYERSVGSARGPQLYGPDGDLLPSDEMIAGLKLPRGLEPVFEEGRDHTYETTVPLAKVQRYFGLRLMTGDVRRMGDRSVFKAAEPRNVVNSEAKIDVTIQPHGTRKVRVRITELPGTPQNPVPEAETRRRAQQDLTEQM
jgi:hypothetical protein